MKTKHQIGLLACCFSLVFISCGSGNHQPETPKKIEVTGSAEMEVIPNEIYMTFTLKEYLNPAKQKVNLEQIKTDFLTQCKTAGIADSNISISDYSGQERYDYYWHKRRKTEPDFMGSVSYVVKASSTEKLDKIVAGLNEKSVESFSVTKTSHSNVVQLRQEVKTNALIAAKAKAEYLAKSIGEEVGEALLIQEIETGNTNYYSNTLSNIREDNNENASPAFQKIKLRYEMKAEFKLK